LCHFAGMLEAMVEEVLLAQMTGRCSDGTGHLGMVVMTAERRQLQLPGVCPHHRQKFVEGSVLGAQLNDIRSACAHGPRQLNRVAAVEVSGVNERIETAIPGTFSRAILADDDRRPSRLQRARHRLRRARSGRRVRASCCMDRLTRFKPSPRSAPAGTAQEHLDEVRRIDPRRKFGS